MQDRSATKPDDVFAGKDGNVYKRGSDGSWLLHGGNGWSKADFSSGRESATISMRDPGGSMPGTRDWHFHAGAVRCGKEEGVNRGCMLSGWEWEWSFEENG